MKTFGAAVAHMLQGLVNTTALVPAGDWLPPEHVDRMRQYEVFRALDENRFARLLSDREAQRTLREYGDIGLIVDTSRDALLGDRVGIEVPGSSDADNPAARARQQLLDGWAERERWASKLYRGESDAALVGDYVLEARPDAPRLRLRVHDPESFFPVWDNSEGDFSEAYLAWEEPNTGQYLPTPAENLAAIQRRDGEVVLYVRHYRLLTREEAALAGVRIAGATEREQIAVVTAGWYRIEKGKGETARGFDYMARLGLEKLDAGAFVIDLDTGFDEVPLWYVPNIESTRQPWGLPEAFRVLQLLLDAAQDHTDLKANTFHNAFPILYDENPVGGAAPRPGAPHVRAEEKYRPGMIYNGRKLGTVDMSKGNELLLNHEKWAIEKALSNSRTTSIAAGKLQPGDIPSGVAMMIALLPLMAKTLPKRQTRKDKLGMMLKHVLRWHRDFGDPAKFGFEGGWPAGMFEEFEAYPIFGSIVPIDKKQVSEIVRDLLTAGAISEETAVVMLQGSGFPIDDASEEVKRLQAGRQVVTGAPGSGLGNEGILIPGLEDE